MVEEKNFIRSAPLMLHSMEVHSQHFFAMTFARQLILSLQAGIFIAVGAALSVFTSVGDIARGPAALLQAFGFIVGFSMVIFSGAALFTEINFIIPMSLLSMRTR